MAHDSGIKKTANRVKRAVAPACKNRQAWMESCWRELSESREQELPLRKALAHFQHMNKEALLSEKWLISQHEACI